MSEKLIIHGGVPLSGKLKIGGSKNSALPILCAAALVDGRCIIQNCPNLSDVRNTFSIIEHLGGSFEFRGNTAEIDAAGLCGTEIPAEYMDRLRSSVLFMGALLARHGRAVLSAPGGCAIGKRAIDFHLNAFRKLGATVEETNCSIICTAPNGLAGAKIRLSFPSVGATENILLAAATARGTTTIRGAAREPEIADLIDFLNSCGAKISGGGTSRVTIHGVSKLHAATHRVIPDRIVAATYMCAVAATRGKATFVGLDADHLIPLIKVLKRAGVTVRPLTKSVIYMNAEAPISGFGRIKTAPYPKFPTDMAPCLMAAALMCNGKTTFVETIFENRFMHVTQLLKAGADIRVKRKKAVVTGVPRLFHAEMSCTDLRGGAAAIITALAANEKSEVDNLAHIRRGYEDIARDMRILGARIV
jgi:UDP-N-acetylglucosamine 1-carboxyvinyltransferase